MLTVKTINKHYIAVPEDLLDKLGVEEGEKVDVKVNRGSLIFVKEKDDFLSLEGSMKDVDIEQPVKELNKKWKAWKPLKSL